MQAGDLMGELRALALLRRGNIHQSTPLAASWDGSHCEECDNRAIWEVLAHRVEFSSSMIQQCADFTWRGCDHCYRIWRLEIDSIMGRLRRYTPVSCVGCGRPLSTSGDIMLRARKL